MTTAREVALDVTAHVRIDDAYSNLILPNAIRDARLSSRDSGHATDLTYGSLRWQSLLDAVLRDCVTGSWERVDAEVLDVLRLATYELIVRRDPPHIINEWVNLANRRVRRAAGFVNATLRAVSKRTPDEWRATITASATDIAGRAIAHSHPEWIVREFTELLGASEADELLVANNTSPVPTLIALPGLAIRPIGAEPTPFSPFGFRSSGGSLTEEPGVADGVVRVQDEGSQLAALLLTAVSPVRSGERWLDLCAGPGGKTAVLAAVGLVAGATVVANEVQAHRAALVRKSLAPFDGRVEITVRDGRELCSENPDAFDRILVDAPCTGLGALRRRPESRWRKNFDDLDELVPLQRELLSAALGSLTVGGVVAYVTCSPLTAETVDVVDAVLAEHPEAEVIDTAAILVSIAPQLTDATRGTAVQLYPHRHDTDAMFIQLIRRTR
jgi:16S rRNA (cytosine967-C5)-methyltransferase